MDINRKGRSNERPSSAERATGFEPVFEAWEATVLPLNYARNGLQIIEGARGSVKSPYRLFSRPLRRRGDGKNVPELPWKLLFLLLRARSILL